MAHSEGLSSCLEQGLKINCLFEEHFLVGWFDGLKSIVLQVPESLNQQKMIVMH